jgi:SAM-dependent methyltransferase
MADRPLKLYSELAKWWPLLSPPSHYVEEAADLLPMLLAAPDAPPHTLLELGSGGGSLAYHLKGELRLTLTDVSAGMLDVNRAVNPECEHVQGDMRTLDLDRTFDVVLIHDAIMYCTDPASVRAALATAARHCRPGGATIVVPDCVKETFKPDTDHGGEDGPDGRALRYLAWTTDPDPADDTFETQYVFAMREADGTMAIEHDLHVEGVFHRGAWLAWLTESGFEASVRMDPWDRDVFAARRRHGVRA